MTAILAPAFQLDSSRKIIQTGALIEAVADILLDLLAVKLGLGEERAVKRICKLRAK